MSKLTAKLRATSSEVTKVVGSAIGLVLLAGLFWLHWTERQANERACLSAGGHLGPTGRSLPLCLSEDGRVIDLREYRHE